MVFNYCKEINKHSGIDKEFDFMTKYKLRFDQYIELIKFDVKITVN